MARFPIWICLLVLAWAEMGLAQQCTEGSESRRGNMYYICRSGFQVPVACSTVDGVRVEPNAQYQTSTFLFTCQQPHSQVYSLVPTACIRNGQVVTIGATSSEENFWYTCTREGDQVVMKLTGCVGEQGTRVGPNGIVTKKSFLFRCAFNGNQVALEPYGCIVEGSHYPAGQDIIAANFWYQCSILQGGGGLELKLSGCMENGQKMFNGSTVVKNGFVFRCEILPDAARFAAVGCLDEQGGHRMLGDTWRENQGNTVPNSQGGQISYVMECKREQNRISKQVRQCYYQSSFHGAAPLDGNCVRRFGPVMVKCVQRDGGRIAAEVYSNASENDYRNAINQGFRQC